MCYFCAAMRRISILRALLLLALFLPAVAAAGKDVRTLSGKVTDKVSGEPLPGVYVIFPDLRQGTVTDTDGNYLAQGLPAIVTTVQVSLLGHQTIIEDVDLRTTSHRDFVLSETDAAIAEAVVTGITGTELRRDSPSPVAIVSARELQESASSNLVDALASKPGISQITTGGGISKPVIRGLGYNRVLVVHDGIRQEGQQWGDEHGVEVDPQSVGSVEILKGPASLVYGSDAMAGVIVLNDYPVLPRGTVSAQAGAEYQSNAGLFGYTGDVAGNDGGMVWDVRWSRRMAHDYRNAADGFVPGTRFSEKAASGMFGINRGWGWSHLKLSLFQLVPGIAEGERDPETGLLEGPTKNGYSPELPFQKVNHLKAVLDNFFIAGEGTVKATLGYQRNRRQEFEESPAEPGLDLLLHTFNWNVQYKRTTAAGWKLVGGAAGMFQKSVNGGDEYLIPDYSLGDAGFFATACREIGEWHVSGGVRADVRFLHSMALEGRFEDFSRTFGGVTGSVGAIRHLGPKSDLRLNLSRGYRAPNLSELGSNGKHEGTLRYEVGNHGLRSESSWQADLGWDYSSSVISAETALFANLVNNYIYLERTGGVSAEGDPVYGYTQGNAFLWGGEFSLDVHPVERMHFENALSLVYSRLAGTGDYLPFTPAPRLVSTLKYDLVRDGKVLTNSYVAAKMEAVAAQNRIHAAGGTETATPGYTLFGLSAGADIRIAGRDALTLMVFADNLFDTVYQSHLSRLKYTGVFNPGRNLGVKILVRL